MWKSYDKYLLPFGEVYCVQRWNNDNTWRGIIIGRETRIQCTTTSSRGTVQRYYNTTKLVQQEALNGENPYISREYALKLSLTQKHTRTTTM